MRRHSALAGALVALAVAAMPRPATPQSLPETVEAMERARVVTRILFVTAHPDDESSSLLTYLSRGLRAEVALLTVTRGQGGQNAVGPELGPELGLIRTEELLAATRQYGVRQFFTRAVDTGYSKSREDTLRIWDNIALEDMVRVLRTFRPQIVINGWAGVRSGHGQHQAVGALTPQAVEAAADPRQFPEQLAQGLKPWKASAVLRYARGEAPAGSFRVPADEISPLWGKTYTELGMAGFANHRSQGIEAFLDSPFFRRPLFLLPSEGGARDLASLAEPLASLAAHFPEFAEQLRPALASADQALTSARDSALKLAWPEAIRQLADAGKEVAELETRLSAASPSQRTAEALAELGEVRRRIDRALALAAAVQVTPRADRSELVAGESFSVSVELECRSGVALADGFSPTSLELPRGWSVTQMELHPPSGARFTVAVPAGAEPPVSPQDAIQPWPEPLVRARLRLVAQGYPFSVEEPAMETHASSTRVETLPLELVPAVTLTVKPRQLLLREKQPARPLQLLARVRYHGSAPAEVVAGVDVPKGWSASAHAPLHFSEAGDQIVRIELTPPAHPAAGVYPLKPYAKLGANIFRASRERLPSLPTRAWSEPAEATVHVLDLAVPEDLRVGYVAAENDPLPEVLRQLGIRVELLDEEELALGDLARFDAVVIGIRAYELRDDLSRANQRLLNYVSAGGTLVVQYQRDYVWNRLKPAPFPAAMASPAARVTDQNSPVRFVAPDSPLLNYPNRITAADFQGWVQERGLYFWSTFEAPYQAVLALRDPGEGEALGSLVAARDGKGTYIYTGLSFFRQLPEGVPGAYRLFVNLLSQSKAKP